MDMLTVEDVEDIFLEFTDSGFYISIIENQDTNHFDVQLALSPVLPAFLDNYSNIPHINIPDEQRLKIKRKLDVFKKRYYNSFTYRLSYDTYSSGGEKHKRLWLLLVRINQIMSQFV